MCIYNFTCELKSYIILKVHAHTYTHSNTHGERDRERESEIDRQTDTDRIGEREYFHDKALNVIKRSCKMI